MVRSTSASWAIASRCSTALVEPPSAITTRIAFRNASRVMMSRGLRPRRRQAITACPAAIRSCSLRGSTAGIEELPGSAMPSASTAEDMVLAVYMPPHAPWQGMAARSMPARSASSIRPALKAPTASNAEIISTSRPRCTPGRMLPPYTNTLGMFSRAIGITVPGMVLSQPPMPMMQSNWWPIVTSSMVSAMASRLTSEAFIPSCPIASPSVTTKVL